MKKKIILLKLLLILIMIVMKSKTQEIKLKQQNAQLQKKDFQMTHCMQYCLNCDKSINSCILCEQKHNCCNWACTTCINQTTCIQCQDGFSLDQSRNICVMQNSCLDEYCSQCSDDGKQCILCLPDFYIDVQMLTCDHCLPHCFDCKDHFTCQQCADSYYINDNKDICLPCGVKCFKCKNSTVCEQCLKPFFVNELGKCEKCLQGCMQCVSKDTCQQCKQGTYFDNSFKLCKLCQVPCSLCNSKTQCSTCIQKFYFNSTDNTCKSCNEIISHCSVCKMVNGLYNRKLISSEVNCLDCESGYFNNQAKNICTSCSANCKVCSDSTNCQSCQPKFFVNASKSCQICTIPLCFKCQSSKKCETCSTGYFWNSSSLYPECDKCLTGCQYCTQTRCVNCLRGFYLKNGHCYRCNPACEICFDDSENCLKCLSGYFTPYLISKCYKCPQPCTQCSNFTSCNECMAGYYISQKICKKCSIENCDVCQKVAFKNRLTQNTDTLFGYSILNQINENEICSQCRQGSFLIDNKCLKCIDSCKICYDSSTCQICVDAYILNIPEKSCLKCPQNCIHCTKNMTLDFSLSCLNCKHGFYVNNKFMCIACVDNCEQCTETLCLQCQKGYFLQRNNQTSKYRCIKCSDPCKQCIDPKQCLVCVSGFYLTGKDECKKCSKGCLECNEHGCFLCDQRFHLEYINSTCVACGVQKCMKCAQSIQRCDECEDGYTYYLQQSNEAIKTSIIQMCYRCDQAIEGCKICSSPQVCSVCFKGLILQTDSQYIRCSEDNNYILISFLVVSFLLVLIILGNQLNQICLALYIQLKRKYKKLIIEKQKQMERSLIENYSINSLDQSHLIQLLDGKQKKQQNKRNI